jgi:anti-sigma B factor antagonist
MLNYCGHEVSGVQVFTVEENPAGEAVMTQREWLYKTIENREDPRFIIDLGAIQYMQSADIGVLVTIKRRVDHRQGKIVLTNVDPFILDILRTMRIDKLFPVAPDMSAALKLIAS